MSDPVPGASDFRSQHRDGYLRTGGAKGHIIDTTGMGGHVFTPHLLLRTKGRKSGKTYVTPLTYGAIGGEVVLVASNGGADAHPNWYLNLRETPEVEFQVGPQAFRATWREPEGAEREKIWNFMVKNLSVYTSYQASTKRRIPLVMIKAAAEIAAFKPEDVG
jgi:deazaflavin-dependent oxidoreductase (nitroreductase family)